MCRAFAPVLKANGGGTIVNILSVIGRVNLPAIGSYCASKAAEYSMTQGVRAELAGQGTQVLGVLPGAVDTDMTPGGDARPEDVEPGPGAERCRGGPPSSASRPSSRRSRTMSKTSTPMRWRRASPKAWPRMRRRSRRSSRPTFRARACPFYLEPPPTQPPGDDHRARPEAADRAVAPRRDRAGAVRRQARLSPHPSSPGRTRPELGRAVRERPHPGLKDADTQRAPTTRNVAPAASGIGVRGRHCPNRPHKRWNRATRETDDQNVPARQCQSNPQTPNRKNRHDLKA